MQSDITTRRRVTTALVGATAVMLTVPHILRMWTPLWAVFGWMLLYAVGIATFIVARVSSENPWIEFIWSVTLSGLFSLIPLSTLVFEPAPEGLWASGAVAAFHITNEIASRNFVTVGDWRVGPILLATCLGLVAAIQVGPIIGLGLGIAFFMILGNAQEIREEEEEIRYERDHDELTGLLNRRGLLDVIETQPGGALTVVMVDADRFKTINDTYGYQAGDALLCAVGDALRERLGPDWKIARQGGDEFVAVATGRPAVSDRVADPVSCTFPYHAGEVEIAVDLSVGVAHSAEAGDVERLMSRAGFAVKAAKRSGAVSRFDSALEQRFVQALEVQASDDLPDDATLFTVAQVITDGDLIVGWELLARWRGVDGSVIAPAGFLPLLAENGLMPQLNDRVLEAGVQFASRFNNRPNAPFVSVNITASHLASPDLVDHVESLLERYRVQPSRLMIEITESEGLDALASWQGTARGLVDLGVKLAIDDFGSGYSSIERMNQLPITHLKFDRSFATSLSGPFGEVVQGVVRFARATGMGVIAEGIETLDEFESMRAIGVELFQGHRFGRPVELDLAERELIEQTSVMLPDPLR